MGLYEFGMFGWPLIKKKPNPFAEVEVDTKSRITSLAGSLLDASLLYVIFFPSFQSLGLKVSIY